MIERFFRIGADRLDDQLRAEIQIRAEHLENARRRERIVSLAQRDLALKLLHRPDELRRGPRVQPQFV